MRFMFCLLSCMFLLSLMFLLSSMNMQRFYCAGFYDMKLIITRTRMEDVVSPAVQWAAVSTWREEMMEPPHQGLLPKRDTSPTCKY